MSAPWWEASCCACPLALGLASIAMIIYVSIRFQFNFAVAALLPLLFNSFVVVAVFSLFQIEINSPFVAVILTIVGYSINDTIVIFDRIRENIKYNPSEKQLAETVNTSVRQSFVRCLNTSVTTLLVVGSLFIGGETITPALPLHRDYLRDDFFALPGQSPLVYPDHEGKAYLLRKNAPAVKCRRILFAAF